MSEHSERMKVASDALLDAAEQAIVALSVHPAGCVEWTWYENLCLEVAERLDNAVTAFKASNAGGEARKPAQERH